MSPILACEGLAVGYGERPVVSGLSLAVSGGEVLAVLGPNGCGKSTVLKTIAGLLPAIGGDVLLSGKTVSALAAEEKARAGIGYVPQTREVFPSLTVRENLLTMGHAQRPIDEVLAIFPVLQRRMKVKAGALSGGERKALGLARVMMARDLRLLLLDEPTAGLAPAVVRDVLALISRLRSVGLAIVMVEQNVRAALELGDLALVIAAGQRRWSGPCAELGLDALYPMFFEA